MSTTASIVLPAYALVPYFPQGTAQTPGHVRMQALVYALKDGRRWRDRRGADREPAEVIARYVARYGGPVLGPERTLVPMPRSNVTPRQVHATRWPALQLARALVDVGLGFEVASVVHRARAIRSARENPRDRPTVDEHVATLEGLARPDALGGFAVSGKITLIDDVLTRGTQFVAAARALRAAGVGDSIEAFAAAWTRTPSDEEHPIGASFRIEWSEPEDYPRRTLVNVRGERR